MNRNHEPCYARCTCTDRQEGQSNWPYMQKTLGKPGFWNGEDWTRTTREFPGKIEVSKRGGAKSDARREDRQRARAQAAHERRMQDSSGHVRLSDDQGLARSVLDPRYLPLPQFYFLIA